MYLQKFFIKYFDLKPAENTLVQLLLLHLTFISAFYTAALSISETLFLAHFDSRQLPHLLPWINICVAIATLLITWSYDRLINRFIRIKLILAADIFFLLSFIVFWYLATTFTQSGWIYFLLLVWAEACSVFKIALFYSFSGDYFSPRDARRVYGYISIGMALGSLLTGFLISSLAGIISVTNLLFLNVISLAVSIFFSYRIFLIGKPVQATPVEVTKEAPVKLKKILESKYIRIIFL